MKNTKGITLIALVITIIVMLILVVVTVTVAMNGELFTKSQTAKAMTDRETKREELSSILVGAVDDIGLLSESSAKSAIESIDENANIEGTNFPLTVTYKGEKFTVTAKGIEKDVISSDDNGDESIGGNEQTIEYGYLEDEGTVFLIYIGNSTNISLQQTVRAIPYGIINSSLQPIPGGEPSNISLTENIVLSFNMHQNLSTLESINFNNVDVYLSSESFNGATSLTTVTGMANIERIDDYTFANCSALTSLVLPEGVTLLNNNAFKNSGLQTIELPSSITQISSNSFSGCSDLTSIRIHKKQSECTIGFQTGWNNDVTVTYNPE